MHIDVEPLDYKKFYDLFADRFASEYAKADEAFKEKNGHHTAREIPNKYDKKFWSATHPEFGNIADSLFSCKGAKGSSYFIRKLNEPPKINQKKAVRCEIIIAALHYIGIESSIDFSEEKDKRPATLQLWGEFVKSLPKPAKPPKTSITEQKPFLEELKGQLEGFAQKGDDNAFRALRKKVITVFKYGEELFVANGNQNPMDFIGKNLKKFVNYKFKSWEKELLINYISNSDNNISNRKKALKIFTIQKLLSDDEIVDLLSVDSISAHVAKILGFLLSPKNNTKMLCISATTSALESSNVDLQIDIIKSLPYMNAEVALSQFERFMDHDMDRLEKFILYNLAKFLMLNWEASYDLSTIKRLRRWVENRDFDEDISSNILSQAIGLIVVSLDIQQDRLEGKRGNYELIKWRLENGLFYNINNSKVTKAIIKF